MQIYDYADYKAFLADHIRGLPKNGRGQARRLAEHLRVNSVVISQVLSGDRDFTPEQGLSTAAYFGFDERSSDYLVNLINKARSATKELARHYDKKLAQARKEAQDLKNQVVEHREITEEDKGVFYSNWFYSGIRLLSSIEGYNSVDAIAAHFGLSRAKVAEVLEFLISRGLCKQEADGRITIGVAATYVDSSSRFINNHRRNWRMKGLEKFSEPGANDLFFSSPFSLSKEDHDHIRKELSQMISAISKRVGASKEEKLVCLNIDWFEF